MFKRAIAVFSAAVITAMIFSCGSDDPTGPVSTVPDIGTQPQSVTAAAGEPVSFFVGATGYPALSYQWLKDGSDIPGAVDWQYVIPSVSPLDSGVYTVVVTNAKGSVTSTPASLTVLSVPSITTQPAWQNVNEGESVTTTIEAAANPPITGYGWWHRLSDSVSVLGGTTTTGSFTINPITLGDAGEWFVVVENERGLTVSNIFVLIVNQTYYAPTITGQPQYATVNDGDPVSFTVTATGTPLPTYQWYNGAGLIPGATDSTYTIASVTASDAGIYYVEVTNLRGSVQSLWAYLTVNKTTFAPTITVQPQGNTVTDGESVSFSVTATGNPLPTYQWYNGAGLIPGATDSTYTIASVTPADAQIYYVVVANSEGSVQSLWAYLTVNPRAPTITTQPLSQPVDEKGTVTLSVIADGTAPLNYQWRLDGAPIPGANSADYTIDTVKLDDAGDYTVVVTNAAGSVTSAPATLTVNQVCPALLSPADGATGVSTTPTLTWEAYPGAVTYEIEVGTTPDVSTGYVVYDPAVTDTTYTIGGPLDPGTLYYWHVVANDGTGNSEWSWIRSFMTSP
jgi:hypothetical protein